MAHYRSCRALCLSSGLALQQPVANPKPASDAPSQSHESPWAACHLVPELATPTPVGSRYGRTRSSSMTRRVIPARHAREGCLHAVPYQPGLQERQLEVLRLATPTFIAASSAPIAKAATRSKGWNVSLDASAITRIVFPLVGAHALVECGECHKGAASGQFEGLSTAATHAIRRTF